MAAVPTDVRDHLIASAAATQRLAKGISAAPPSGDARAAAARSPPPAAATPPEGVPGGVGLFAAGVPSPNGPGGSSSLLTSVRLLVAVPLFPFVPACRFRELAGFAQRVA